MSEGEYSLIEGECYYFNYDLHFKFRTKVWIIDWIESDDRFF